MVERKKNSEFRLVVLLVLLVVLVCVSGVILYQNLSTIANKVGSSAKTDTRNSLALRQVLIDLREAENEVKSYNLTYNKEHLLAFYNTISSFETQTEEIGKARKHNQRERFIVNNVILMAEKRFELLKQQLYLDDEEKITDELNAISVKIDEAYKNRLANQSAINEVTPLETQAKKESFFKRLFGKKSKQVADTVKSKPVKADAQEVSMSQLQGELKSTVKRVKNTQLEKLAERKGRELQLSSEGQALSKQMSELVNELEVQEDQLLAKKIALAQKDMNTIQNFSILFSIVISILLIVVAYLIVNYVRKKKEYELALIKAKRSAEDLARTKETFLANMSHEIKTPLNAIYGFTEQVLHSDISTKQYEQLSIVQKSADYLSKLVNNILSYSKLQAGKIEIENVDFNLKREMDDLAILFATQLEGKNVKLRFEKSPEVPDYINCDLTKLKQILFNVIGNAIKFTEKGQVNVLISPRNIIDKAQLCIRVQDTGIGIPAARIPKLFNEYEQADNTISKKYGGTGLGLVITKKIVEQMDGSISLESKEGEGTTFEILIPYTLAVNVNIGDDGETISMKEMLAILKQKKILIVDDEEFNRLLLKSILSKYDMQLFEAINGVEAVHLVKNHFFDLVIMDLNMPEKDGINACKEIRTFNPGIPILVSTAVISEEQTNKCLKEGFNGFVYKPFAERDLLGVLIHQLLASSDSSGAEPLSSGNNQHKVNLTHLQVMSNGDELFAKELVEIFHKSINKATKAIETACEKSDWLIVADIAHKNMAACKHFDAYDLYNCLKYFEGLRNSPPEKSKLKEQLIQLNNEVQNINHELQLYL